MNKIPDEVFSCGPSSREPINKPRAVDAGEAQLKRMDAQIEALKRQLECLERLTGLTFVTHGSLLEALDEAD